MNNKSICKQLELLTDNQLIFEEKYQALYDYVKTLEYIVKFNEKRIDELENQIKNINS